MRCIPDVLPKWWDAGVPRIAGRSGWLASWAIYSHGVCACHYAPADDKVLAHGVEICRLG